MEMNETLPTSGTLPEHSYIPVTPGMPGDLLDAPSHMFPRLEKTLEHSMTTSSDTRIIPEQRERMSEGEAMVRLTLHDQLGRLTKAQRDALHMHIQQRRRERENATLFEG